MNVILHKSCIRDFGLLYAWCSNFKYQMNVFVMMSLWNNPTNWLKVYRTFYVYYVSTCKYQMDNCVKSVCLASLITKAVVCLSVCWVTGEILAEESERCFRLHYQCFVVNVQPCLVLIKASSSLLCSRPNMVGGNEDGSRLWFCHESMKSDTNARFLWQRFIKKRKRKHSVGPPW